MKNKQLTLKKVVVSLAAALVAAPAFAETTVNWGGDIIIRPFHRDNARDFNNNVNDTKNFTTSRARLKADIRVSEDIGGTVELMNFKMWGSADPNRIMGGANSNGSCSPTTTTVVGAAGATAGTTALNCSDMSWFGVNQAYIEVKNVFDSGLFLKAGTQEMAYGDQRLIGNTNFWSTFPFPRSYDAVKVGGRYATFDIDAFMAKVTERQLGTLFGATNTASKPSDRDLRGIWATLKMIPDNTIDLFVLNMADNGYLGTGALGTANGSAAVSNFGNFPYQKNAANPISRGTSVYNWGTRLKGKYSGLDYTVELNAQTGNYADGGNISANAGAARVGYTIPEAMGLRIGGEYVFASGDSTPTVGDHKTFYQFTPSPHGMLGAQDFIAFQNIKAWKLGASINAKENLKISVDYWNFELDKVQDAWYGSNGISTRGTTAGLAGAFNGAAFGGEGMLADKKIGSEVDLIAKYEYSKPLTLELGYSVFNPGTGIKNATAANLAGITAARASDTAVFAWGMLMLKF